MQLSQFNYAAALGQLLPGWRRTRLFSWHRSTLKGSACYGHSAPSPYHIDGFEEVKDRYSEGYTHLYNKLLRGSLGNRRFKPFGSLEYPCKEDFRETSYLAKDVHCEDVLLQRKANGKLLMRIYTSKNAHSSSPVVIYLPSRATSLGLRSMEHDLVSYLTSKLKCTTISVGYHINPPFPTSLHECLEAVDWARRNIPTVNLTEYSESLSGRLMAVIGTGIGGGLASSIAITEGRESGIIAAGAWVPIVDWAFDPLPEIPSSKHSTLPRSPGSLQSHLAEYDELTDYRDLPIGVLKAAGLNTDLLSTFDPIADNPFLSTSKLKGIRGRYIKTAEDYIDPFVSPLYWFKSSGVNIWTRVASMIEDELLINPEDVPVWVSKMRDQFVRTGRRSKLYPPLDFVGSLTVPPMRIISAEGDILAAQTSEFVEAARAALFPRDPKAVEGQMLEELKDIPETKDRSTLLEEQEKLEYRPVAKHYIQSDIVKGAGHCLITAPTEELHLDAITEVINMGSWLDGVFRTEPAKAMEWARGRSSHS